MDKPKLPGIITARYLARLGACRAGLEYFNEAWPAGTPLTDDVLFQEQSCSVARLNWVAQALRARLRPSTRGHNALRARYFAAQAAQNATLALCRRAANLRIATRAWRLARTLCLPIDASLIREHFDVVDGATDV